MLPNGLFFSRGAGFLSLPYRVVDLTSSESIMRDGLRPPRARVDANRMLCCHCDMGRAVRWRGEATWRIWQRRQICLNVDIVPQVRCDSSPATVDPEMRVVSSSCSSRRPGSSSCGVSRSRKSLNAAKSRCWQGEGSCHGNARPSLYVNTRCIPTIATKLVASISLHLVSVSLLLDRLFSPLLDPLAPLRFACSFFWAFSPSFLETGALPRKLVTITTLIATTVAHLSVCFCFC